MKEDKNGVIAPPRIGVVSAQHKWEESWAKKTDEKELLDLFKESFGHSMLADQWLWKYPDDQPLGVCIRKQGHIIAFYGGVPRGIRFLGEKAEAVQICDVMVAPSQRGVLTRRGALFHASLTFTENLLGPGKKFFCGFGFPSERHQRLGELYGIYKRVGGVIEAVWAPIARPLALTSLMVPLPFPSQPLLSDLWQSMAKDLTGKVVLERDGAYIQNRFLEHPTIEYLSFLVLNRFSKKPLGLLILRDHGAEGVELVDMVGSLVHMPTLVSSAQRLTGKLRRPRLFAWLTSPVAAILKKTNPQLMDLNIPIPIVLPASAWQRVTDLPDTRDLWWLIGGDTDFR